MTVAEAVSIHDTSAGALKGDLDTSVGKALALLSSFDRVSILGVTELARRVGVSKSTAFRLLAILQEWNLVEREGRRYRLGTRVFELGNQVSFCRPHNLRESAHPFLQDLYEVTHETVHLAVLDGQDVVYVDKVFGKDPVPSPSRIGGRVPAHCAAVGKAILAFADEDIVRAVLDNPLQTRTRYTTTLPRLLIEELARIRRMGVAFDREEANLGLTCVAAPIFGPEGRSVAAVSISGATGRFQPDRHVWTVRRGASGISQSLYRPAGGS
jgi:DNA-binding IclR family transcriptional regulator